MCELFKEYEKFGAYATASASLMRFPGTGTDAELEERIFYPYCKGAQERAEEHLIVKPHQRAQAPERFRRDVRIQGHRPQGSVEHHADEERGSIPAGREGKRMSACAPLVEISPQEDRGAVAAPSSRAGRPSSGHPVPGSRSRSSALHDEERRDRNRRRRSAKRVGPCRGRHRLDQLVGFGSRKRSIQP
jgi:hypothetical protein